MHVCKYSQLSAKNILKEVFNKKDEKYFAFRYTCLS